MDIMIMRIVILSLMDNVLYLILSLSRALTLALSYIPSSRTPPKPYIYSDNLTMQEIAPSALSQHIPTSKQG